MKHNLNPKKVCDANYITALSIIIKIHTLIYHDAQHPSLHNLFITPEKKKNFYEKYNTIQYIASKGNLTQTDLKVIQDTYTKLILYLGFNKDYIMNAYFTSKASPVNERGTVDSKDLYDMNQKADQFVLTNNFDYRSGGLKSERLIDFTFILFFFLGTPVFVGFFAVVLGLVLPPKGMSTTTRSLLIIEVIGIVIFLAAVWIHRRARYKQKIRHSIDVNSVELKQELYDKNSDVYKILKENSNNTGLFFSIANAYHKYNNDNGNTDIPKTIDDLVKKHITYC